MMNDMIDEKKQEDSIAEDEMEVCVVCGHVTDVPKNQPVSLRKTYVQAGGQLCKACCWQIYHTYDLRTMD